MCNLLLSKVHNDIVKFILKRKAKMDSEFFIIKEAAAIFSTSEVTIRRAIKSGFIIAIRLGNSKRSPYRISRKSIEAIHASIILKHSHLAKKS
jgi:hypothetical protein